MERRRTSVTQMTHCFSFQLPGNSHQPERSLVHRTLSQQVLATVFVIPDIPQVKFPILLYHMVKLK